MSPSPEVLRRVAFAALPLVVLALVVPVLWSLAGAPGAETPSGAAPGPALGTDATSAAELRSTLQAMGRPAVRWNVSYMSDDHPLDVVFLDSAAAMGVRHQVVTIEFWSLGDQSQVLLKIAEGAVDAHLRSIAAQMRAWSRRHPGSELVVRPLHEANLASYPWGFGPGNTHDNQRADFAPAWTHVWQVMREVAPGLKFFLCPNGADASSYNWGVPAQEVDYVGHDLYNRSQVSGDWQAPGELHDGTIFAIRVVYPGKPYVIAETATSEPGSRVSGHSKAEWFRDLAAWMKDSAAGLGLVAVCYFDHDKTRQEANDFRIYPAGKPGAEQSRKAFRRAFAPFP